MSVFNLMPFDRRVNLEATNPFRDMENFASGFFRDSAFTAIRTDIQDKGDHYLLEADMPGMSRDNVHVDVQDGVLTISTEVNEENKQEDNGRYIYRERRYGRASRSFNLDGIRDEAITAEFKDGVLRLNLPKETEPERANSRTIEIH